jgi:hypothetical protein
VDGETQRALRSVIAAVAKQGLRVPRSGLLDLGWDELLAEDPDDAIRVLFEAQGAHLLATAALDSVLLAALDGGLSWHTTAVAYPVPGQPSCAPAGGVLIDGLVLEDPDSDPGAAVDSILVPISSSAHGVAVGLLSRESASFSPVRGLDPDLGLHRLHAHAQAVVPLPPDLQGQWPAALAAARRALSHQITGLIRHVLGTVVSHVTTRTQFGRPIGSNQAIQHRLSDVLVDLESAELVAGEAWTTATPLAAKAAKALAGRAMATAAANCQQALGAIGYSWEHEFHRYLKRGLVLDRLLGSVEELETEIGCELADTGIARIGEL